MLNYTSAVKHKGQKPSNLFCSTVRSSCLQVFFKSSSVRRQSLVLESIFNKVTKLKTGNCIKEETPLQNKFFSVSFTKFLRTTFFKELLRWLLRNDFQKIFKTKFFQKLGALASENSL